MTLPFGRYVLVTNTVNVATNALVSLQGGTFSGGTINNAGHIDMATASNTLRGRRSTTAV